MLFFNLLIRYENFYFYMIKRELRKSPKFLSLFSGCGGLDLGFTYAGYQSIGAFDINQVALDVYKKNLDCNAYKCDLSSGELPINGFSSVDVILSGSPCQGFSTLGKRKLDDPRNQLLLVGGQIAVNYKPKVFIAENVPGVKSGKHKKYWDKLHRILREGGYKTREIKCLGTDVGLSQKRTRLFLVAWKSTKELSGNIPYVRGGVLRDVLTKDEFIDNHDVSYLPEDSIHYKIASQIQEGQKLSNVRGGPRSVHTWHIPEVYGKTTKKDRAALEAIQKLRRQIRKRDNGDADPVATNLLIEKFGETTILGLVSKGYLREIGDSHDLVGTFNGKYRRLAWDSPSLTVDTRFGDPKYFLHPDEHRGFTVREAARIQGFPDTFIFDGSISDQYKMVGNAVPPPMAYQLANFVYDRLFK